VPVVRGCDFPEDRYYHTDHNVWLKSGEPGTVVLGATSYGTVVESDRAVGLLELAKTVISVRTPLTATIIASNDTVVKRPDTINQDPYGGGWLVRLRVAAGLEEIPGLLSGAAIAPAFEEAMRLDNFEGVQR
jgi:glycine cleavage system H protein